MDDLVKQLRDFQRCPINNAQCVDDRREAADRIEAQAGEIAKLKEHIDGDGELITNQQGEIERLRACIEEMRDYSYEEAVAENESLRADYHDLIYCVGEKWAGESRHETAKRYIQERENQPSQSGQALSQDVTEDV